MMGNDDRYQSPEDEPMRLDEVLEPFDSAAPTRSGGYGSDFGDPSAWNEPPYQESAYEGGAYGEAGEPSNMGEPYGSPDPYNASDPYDGGELGDNPYTGDGGPYYGEETYDEEYSDYHEELDHENRVRTAVGVFDTVSTLVGVVVILVLAAMLFSLVSWLQTDVTHSLTLLQSGLR